jgi:NAD(P)-dependent dehydrogenase (short-subunit alcohol dehydrogenase family)
LGGASEAVSEARTHVLITGCSRGLGRALVAAFVKRGSTVFPVVRAQRVATELEAGAPDNVHAIVADIRSPELVSRISQVLGENGGVLDVLVNNAGTRGYVFSISDDPGDEITALFDVHCLGALRATQSVLPFLRRSAVPLVVNITSRLGSVRRTSAGEFAGQRLSYSYRIAKAAQNMLTLCLHQELDSEGVAVCAVHPGLLLTDSGPPDAATSAEEGARRLADWILTADSSVAGTYRELDSGYSDW